MKPQLLVLFGILQLGLALGFPNVHSKHRHPAHHRADLQCDPCLPGWGVVSRCNGTHSTVCAPCQSGHWAPRHPHLSHCRVCSKCGDGLYVDRKCRPDRDTSCGWCSGSKGHFNIDFLAKCLKKDQNMDSMRADALKMFYKEEKARKEKDGHPPFDGDVHHKYWFTRDEITDFRPEEVAYKPSFHGYPVEELSRAHRRRLYVLIGLGGVLILTAVVFLVFLARVQCAKRRMRGRSLYVQLAAADNEIVHQCARRIYQDPKQRSESSSTLVEDEEDNNGEEEWWEEDMMKITENPLESYVDHRAPVHQTQHNN